MNREADTKAFLWFVWSLCSDLRGSITSGIRTDSRNGAVGGHPMSKHTVRGGWGLACDVVFDHAGARDLARERVSQEGYHSYVGEDYAPSQLHIQAYPVGVVPEEADPFEGTEEA